jgi:hypothetical protein
MAAQLSKGQARDIPGKGAYQKAVAALLELLLVSPDEPSSEGPELETEQNLLGPAETETELAFGVAR